MSSVAFVSPAQAAGVDIKVNFQTVGAPVPAGYLRDFGEGYGQRTAADQGNLTYGWVAPGTSTPRDMTVQGRDREKNTADQRLDTLIHMQMASSPGSWEIALANGDYDVTVAAGDAQTSASTDLNTIRVEGVTAINQFTPSGANGTYTRNLTAAVRVTVSDGKLTLDANGGTNTKINYVDIASASDRPYITSVNPANGATNVARNISVAANVSVPKDGINGSTVNANTVRLLNISTGAIVPSSVNTSGGGDIITLTPSSVLDPNTQYRLDVTDGVKAGAGSSFLPFSSTFTTGTSGGPSGGNSTIAFVKKDNAAPNPTNDLFSSLVIGPDGKMYVTSLLGTITRYTINSTDGTLNNPQVITTVQTTEGTSRAIIGLAFDPASTANNLILWISHNGEYVERDAPDWTGKIARLSGPNLATMQNYVVNLPHSFKDHMVNSLAFGPDGKLYVTVGSNSAMGAPDAAWGQRPERLLSGAVLQIDTAAITSPPLDVKTEEGGNYNPYATNAPVKLYATGIRNAYDLVWHSNGNLYTPTNGSAAGGNTPAIPASLPAACAKRIDGTAYTSPKNVPGLTNVGDQDDFLFRVVPGGYYGSPNPLRCEWILNGGNPTDGVDPGEVIASAPPLTYKGYPVGTQPDPNWRGAAYNFGKHKSPNGAIEYRSNAFDGKLKGKLLVVRYSANDDIVVLNPTGPNGDISNVQEGLPGLTNLSNPLDLTENAVTGDLYVVSLGETGGQIKLLRPLGGPIPKIDVTPDQVVTNDKQDGSVGRAEIVTIRNVGTATLTLSSIAIIGPDQGQFQFVGTKPTSIAVGASATVKVAMNALGTGADAAGPKGAVLQFNSNDPTVPVLEIPLRGLATLGTGGTNEPSLQWILDTYQIPINVGDDNPKDNIINSDPAKQKAPLLGDEVDLQQFKRSDNASPVVIEPLAVFGPTDKDPVVRFGWYTSGSAAAKNELFSVSNNPTTNGQRVNPLLNPGAALTFDPGTGTFGFYSIWPHFSNRELFSEDALNTFSGAIPHHVRVYPLKESSGTVVPNAYIVAFEENTSGFDFQDVVLIVRNVKDANGVTAPIANAGPDQTVVVNTPVTINGTGSDAESDPLTFNWQQTSGPAVTLSGNGGSRTFTPTSIGTYVFTLTATDPGGLSGTDSVVITVTDPPTPNNLAPTANAGTDQTVGVGASVTLTGSGSDPDGTILGYRWQQTSGLSVALSNDINAQISFKAPDQPTVLTFSLIVTDNQGVVSVADEVQVVVINGPVGGNTTSIFLPLVENN